MEFKKGKNRTQGLKQPTVTSGKLFSFGVPQPQIFKATNVQPLQSQVQMNINRIPLQLQMQLAQHQMHHFAKQPGIMPSQQISMPILSPNATQRNQAVSIITPRKPMLKKNNPGNASRTNIQRFKTTASEYDVSAP